MMEKLILKGDVSGQLRRVSCGQDADFPVPYELVRNYAGSLAGRPLSKISSGDNPVGGSIRFAIEKLGFSADSKLLGLWEGIGELKDSTPASILWSVIDDGLATMVRLPHWDLQLSVSNGVCTLTANRAGGDRLGRYRLGGGIQSGTLFLTDDTGEWALQGTDPQSRMPGFIAVTGHC